MRETFLAKLRAMIASCSPLISWNEAGNGFVIRDVEAFGAEGGPLSIFFFPDAKGSANYSNFIRNALQWGFFRINKAHVEYVLLTRDNLFHKDTPERDVEIKTKLVYEHKKEAMRVYGFDFPHVNAYKTTPGAEKKRRDAAAVMALLNL